MIAGPPANLASIGTIFVEWFKGGGFSLADVICKIFTEVLLVPHAIPGK
jgi:hypothetical protein